ncbi:MAG: YraN family protein [Clostridia bacterium]|nr:YraN family protein [Clostridia bacterium]
MFNAKTWKDGEFLAQQFLKNAGYKIIETNSKLAGAEVDIVALYSKRQKLAALKVQFKNNQITKPTYELLKKQAVDTYVFVEVKARNSLAFGAPEQAVNKQKQAHIKRFAQAFIIKNHLENCGFRFDVISVLVDGNKSKIEHFVEAF